LPAALIAPLDPERDWAAWAQDNDVLTVAAQDIADYRYSFNVIPPIGQAVTGDRDSYQYLVESIRRFPDQERFAAMIREAGFGQVKYRNLTMGVAALHSGWRL